MKRSFLGIDWGDLGKNVFGGVHMTGKALASAFGFGGVAQQLEQLESPILPAWAKSLSSVTVSVPDYVIVIKSTETTPLSNALQVSVSGGTRVDGTGYKTGDGLASKKFSFAYKDPKLVVILTSDGSKISLSDVKMVVFLGGQEAQTRITGLQPVEDSMSSIYEGHEYESLNLVGDDLGEAIIKDLIKSSDPIENEQNELYDYVERDAQQIDDAYVVGTCIIGASAPKRVPKRAGIVISRSPQLGREHTTLQLGHAKTHAESIANARDVGRRSIKLADRLSKVLGKAKRSATVSRLLKLVAVAKGAGQTLLKQADKHESAVKQVTSRLSAGVQGVQRITQPRGGGTRVHGEVLASVIGAGGDSYWSEVLGGGSLVGDDGYWREIMGSLTESEVEDETEIRALNETNFSRALPNELKAAAFRTGQLGTDDRRMMTSIGQEYDPVFPIEHQIVTETGEIDGTEPHAFIGMGYDAPFIGAETVGDSVSDLVSWLRKVRKTKKLGVGADYTLPASYFQNQDGSNPVDGSSSPSPTDGSTPPTDGSSGTLDPSMDPAQNYGLPPPPTLADAQNALKQFAATDPGAASDQTVYTTTPAGAVIYDGSKPFNHGDVGSRVCFYGDTGASSGEGVEPEPQGSQDYNAGLHNRGGFRWHNDGWWYNWGGDNQRGGEGNDLRAMGKGPHHWGPLMGNPQSMFAGLRYDTANNVWFWFRDTAPDWASANDAQVQLAKMLLDYKTAWTQAAADAAAKQAQDKLDALNAANLAKQQGLEDAALARQQQVQQQKDDAAAAQTQAQADQQQAAFDQAQSQQQAQFDFESQKADLADAQAQAQHQREMDMYAIQHPGSLDKYNAHAAAQQGGGYGDSGGGGEGSSDMTPPPESGYQDPQNVDWGPARDQMQGDRGNDIGRYDGRSRGESAADIMDGILPPGYHT